MLQIGDKVKVNKKYHSHLLLEGTIYTIKKIYATNTYLYLLDNGGLFFEHELDW